MLKVAIAAAVCWVMVAGFGCRENQTSFFIENVKAQPAAPTCESSAGDPVVAEGILDLSFRNPYGAYVSLKNQLMSREELQNLRAESAGIFVDGAEVYVQDLNGGLLSGTEYYEYGTYIPPESSDIAYATLVSKAVVDTLAQNYGCPEVTRKPFQPFNSDIGQIYSVVRVLGHTNSAIDLKTPEFSFLINICCGCLVNWDGCYDPCSRYCQDSEASDMCTQGVGPSTTGYDCREAFHDLNATWPSSTAQECLGDDGTTPRDCTCADCKSST